MNITNATFNGIYNNNWCHKGDNNGKADAERQDVDAIRFDLFCFFSFFHFGLRLGQFTGADIHATSRQEWSSLMCLFCFFGFLVFVCLLCYDAFNSTVASLTFVGSTTVGVLVQKFYA